MLWPVVKETWSRYGAVPADVTRITAHSLACHVFLHNLGPLNGGPNFFTSQLSRKFKHDHVCATCDDCHGCPCWFWQKSLTIKLGDCHEKDSPSSRPGPSVDHWHGTDQRICVSSFAAFDGPLLHRQGGHSAFCSHSPLLMGWRSCRCWCARVKKTH